MELTKLRPSGLGNAISGLLPVLTCGSRFFVLVDEFNTFYMIPSVLTGNQNQNLQDAFSHVCV